MVSKQNPHWGTSLDEFLAEEGFGEAAKAEARARLTPNGTLMKSFKDFADDLLRERSTRNADGKSIISTRSVAEEFDS